MVETVNDMRNALVGMANNVADQNFGSYAQGLEERNIDEIGNMLDNIRNG